MEKNYLYGLTVQGIQSYIFATNKLKEIIGASEIIEQLCTTWFYDFLTKEECKGSIRHLNAAGNIRFQTDKETAKRIFRDYHFILLEKAPGVPFSQAVVEIKNGKEYEAIQNLDKKLRAQRNSPLYEIDLGVMLRSKNRRTGDFAFQKQIYNKEKNKFEFLDVVSNQKYIKRKGKALTEKIELSNNNIVYPSEFEELAKGGTHSWLAVVHIDGNGMGIIIKDILENGVDKFTELKSFSKSIADCTINAYKKAITDVVLPEKTDIEIDNIAHQQLPIRPLIIGGDDVTVIIRADLALEFTQVYLETFEEETLKAKLNNNKGVTACAGIAYVKEKFPFHYSANLAEELCTYAKNKSERKASAIQFHLVNDSIIDNYKEIVARELKVSEDFTFQKGPYYLDKYKDSEANKELLSTLTKTIAQLKQEDSPKNSMREWVDAKFNKPNMTNILMDRLKAKTSGYNTILENEKAFIDYHTLLAVNTKTD